MLVNLKRLIYIGLLFVVVVAVFGVPSAFVQPVDSTFSPFVSKSLMWTCDKDVKLSGFHILEENKYDELSFKKGVNSTKKINCLDLENAAGPETTVLENAGLLNTLLENADIENAIYVLLEKLRSFIFNGKEEV